MPGTVLPHVPVFIHIDGTRWKHKPDTQTVAGLSLLALPDVSASAPVPACACAHARAPPWQRRDAAEWGQTESRDKNFLTISRARSFTRRERLRFTSVFVIEFVTRNDLARSPFHLDQNRLLLCPRLAGPQPASIRLERMEY